MKSIYRRMLELYHQSFSEFITYYHQFNPRMHLYGKDLEEWDSIVTELNNGRYPKHEL